MARSIRKKEQQDILLSEGIRLSAGGLKRGEDRWLNLFVRAAFLFAIVTGSLGGMLSAFEISYSKWTFFLCAFFAALYCASLYSARWWENIGYVLIFLVALYVGIGLRTYISSGFYGILNDISYVASDFFGSDAQISYAEQVENHYLAVSAAMCYFALIGCIITNALISHKARYFMASLSSLFFLLVPIYLEREPEGVYVILLASGLITVYVFRHSQYPHQQPNEKTFRKAAEKHLFLGNFSGRAATGTLFGIALVCSIVVTVTGLILPKDSFTADGKRSALKLQTMDTMENFYLLGMMGLINFYPTTGGLVNGRLGGVGSVRLDYETDLTLEFVPYTYERIYLKTFVGAEYIPYENHWSIENKTAYAEGWDSDTARRLEDAFLSGEEGYAEGIMKIRNVAAMTGVYLPYYSQNTDKILPALREQTYTYYPLLVKSPPGSAKPLESSLWLEIPEANRQTVADFCAEAGLSGSTQEIIAGLRNYFQENYPYTLSPGTTPRRKDFVNYFLAEKRKGYCAHYATSAVLILRYMGIPARYVEGYAVDALEIAEDAKLTYGDISDYYKGTSLINQESVVSYDASDGNAHAWVEIYDANIGWYPIELTPYRTDNEEDRTSLWDMFTRLFRTEQGTELIVTDSQNEADGNTIGTTARETTLRLVFCLILLLLAIPVWSLIKSVIYLYRYRRADRNEKLLMRYRHMILKISSKNRRNRDLRNKKNFEEQIAWLAAEGILPPDDSVSAELTRVLDKAAFSRREISEEEFSEACRKLITPQSKFPAPPSLPSKMPDMR